MRREVAAAAASLAPPPLRPRLDFDRGQFKGGMDEDNGRHGFGPTPIAPGNALRCL
jgi:hypothetical protein